MLHMRRKKIRLNRNLFVFRSEVKIKVEDFPLDKDGTMWVLEKIRVENCADAWGRRIVTESNHRRSWLSKEGGKSYLPQNNTWHWIKTR